MCKYNIYPCYCHQHLMTSRTECIPSITCNSCVRSRRDLTFSPSSNDSSSHRERMYPLISFSLKMGMYCSRPIVSSNLKICRTQRKNEDLSVLSAWWVGGGSCLFVWGGGGMLVSLSVKMVTPQRRITIITCSPLGCNRSTPLTVLA